MESLALAKDAPLMLNVRGTTFEIARAILEDNPGSALEAIFSGR